MRAQLDLMEKRGSGLKRICNETKELSDKGQVPLSPDVSFA